MNGGSIDVVCPNRGEGGVGDEQGAFQSCGVLVAPGKEAVKLNLGMLVKRGFLKWDGRLGGKG